MGTYDARTTSGGMALALPDTTEAPHHERTSFRVGGKIFATMPPDGASVNVLLDEEEAREAAEESPGLGGAAVVGAPAVRRPGRPGPRGRATSLERAARGRLPAAVAAARGDRRATANRFWRAAGAAPMLGGPRRVLDVRGASRRPHRLAA